MLWWSLFLRNVYRKKKSLLTGSKKSYDDSQWALRATTPLQQNNLSHVYLSAFCEPNAAHPKALKWGDFSKCLHHDMSHGWVAPELFKLFVRSLWHYETMAQKQLNSHITLSLPHLWGQIQPSSSTHIHTLLNKKRAASTVGRHGTITGFKVYRWLEMSWFQNH